MFINVDLPEPEAPMIATNSPRSTRRLTPRSARTSTSPRLVGLVQIDNLDNRGHRGARANA